MKAVVQRVNRCEVTSEGVLSGSIGKGLCVLLGVAEGDTEAQVDWLVEKIVHLRLFEDQQNKMNLSLLDVGGSMAVVSQFTLLGDCCKGRRPSFCKAADPETADRLYQLFVAKVKEKGLDVQTGVFRTHMVVSLDNDGPVTLIVETPGGEE